MNLIIGRSQRSNPVASVYPKTAWRFFERAPYCSFVVLHCITTIILKIDNDEEAVAFQRQEEWELTFSTIEIVRVMKSFGLSLQKKTLAFSAIMSITSFSAPSVTCWACSGHHELWRGRKNKTGKTSCFSFTVYIFDFTLFYQKVFKAAETVHVQHTATYDRQKFQSGYFLWIIDSHTDI